METNDEEFHGTRVVLSIRFNSLIKVWEAHVEFEAGIPTVIHGKSFKYIVDRIAEELDERMMLDV